MTERCLAPWTGDQVWSLNEYQQCGYHHPFTGDDGSILVATRNGWVNPTIDLVVQDWAHKFMADWSWKDPTLEHSASGRPVQQREDK